MQLLSLRDRTWQIQACSALTGEGIKVSIAQILKFKKASKCQEF
jgi:hypothetical protein